MKISSAIKMLNRYPRAMQICRIRLFGLQPNNPTLQIYIYIFKQQTTGVSLGPRGSRDPLLVFKLVFLTKLGGFHYQIPRGLGPATNKLCLPFQSRGLPEDCGVTSPPIVIQVGILNKGSWVPLPYPSGFRPCLNKTPFFFLRAGVSLWTVG